MAIHQPSIRHPTLLKWGVLSLLLVLSPCALAQTSEPTLIEPQGPAIASPATPTPVEALPAPTLPPTRMRSSAPAVVPEFVPPLESMPLAIPLTGSVESDTVDVRAAGDGLVTLLVRDAPLQQVLALIAETQKLNVVFTSSEEVKVTVALDKVTVEVALDSILSSCGLTWTRHGDVVHITKPNLETKLAPHVQGRRVQMFDLDYALAADLDLAIKGMLSPVGQSWVTQSSPSDNHKAREAVVVEDMPPYLDRIASYVSQADQPPRQVLVEVQVLQVKLTDDRKRGINFEEIGRLGGTSLNFRTVGFADGASTQSFFIEGTGGDLSSLVELLQTTSDAKSLASPKLLALNGQKARIQIGEKLGYRVTTTTETSSLESVDFIEVGVVVEVTPWITRDGRVMFKVLPKVSDGEVDPLTGLPSERTTEVETNVFLEDGQGIVLGGLIQERDDISQNKVPLLGDIPYAGVFFQRKVVTRNRSEIIVAMMPHLMPFNAEQQARNDLEVMRARTPLTQGPLCKSPRPFEPSMPDAYDYERGMFARPECNGCAPLGPRMLRRLPAISEAGTSLPANVAQQPYRLPAAGPVYR